MPVLRVLRYNGTLVTSTVVSLTTTKFKPLNISVWHQLFLYREFVHFMIMYNFCLLLQNFVM
jgi:hypothetical protein